MIMTDEWVDIMDHSDLLCTMILSSEPFYLYLNAHRAVYTDTSLAPVSTVNVAFTSLSLAT